MKVHLKLIGLGLVVLVAAIAIVAVVAVASLLYIVPGGIYNCLIKPVRVLRGKAFLGDEEYWRDEMLRKAFNVRRFEKRFSIVRLIAFVSFVWVAVGILLAAMYPAAPGPTTIIDEVLFGVAMAGMLPFAMASMTTSTLDEQKKEFLARQLASRSREPVLF